MKLRLNVNKYSLTAVIVSSVILIIYALGLNLLVTYNWDTTGTHKENITKIFKPSENRLSKYDALIEKVQRDDNYDKEKLIDILKAEKNLAISTKQTFIALEETNKSYAELLYYLLFIHFLLIIYLLSVKER